MMTSRLTSDSLLSTLLGFHVIAFYPLYVRFGASAGDGVKASSELLVVSS